MPDIYVTTGITVEWAYDEETKTYPGVEIEPPQPTGDHEWELFSVVTTRFEDDECIYYTWRRFER